MHFSSKFFRLLKKAKIRSKGMPRRRIKVATKRVSCLIKTKLNRNGTFL